eukprot:m.182037 g.182037  ORF g.182037 m.182037 type:complete len:87 (+) comp39284_c0_seq4:613-873(+)
MNQSNATTEEFLLMSEEWKKFASQIDFGQEEMETFKLLKKAGNQLAHLPIDLVKMRQVFAKKMTGWKMAVKMMHCLERKYSDSLIA